MYDLIMVLRLVSKFTFPCRSAYVKNNVFVPVSVPVSSPFPFMRSYRIEFYFSVVEATRLELRPPGPAALQAPAATAERPVYGHGTTRHNGTETWCSKPGIIVQVAPKT